VSEGNKIWIQGAGDLASGVAWRLVRDGYRVVMAEIPRPVAVRRLVCFGEAVHEGAVTVAGIVARLATASEAEFRADEVTVLVDPAGEQMPRLAPDAVVDARMTKKPPDFLPAGNAPIIGLGPGFRCGRDARLVVETHREAELGAVIDSGEAVADTGVPGRVGGKTGERLLRSPAAGRLEADAGIGDLVEAGAVVGRVAGHPVRATIAGRLRGLIRSDVELTVGMKIGDVDPRGAAVDPAVISDKALTVGGGVIAALWRLGILSAGEP